MADLPDIWARVALEKGRVWRRKEEVKTGGVPRGRRCAKGGSDGGRVIAKFGEGVSTRTCPK